MAGVAKKMTVLSTAVQAVLNNAVHPASVAPGSLQVNDAVSAVLNPVFMFQATDPYGKDQLNSAQTKATDMPEAWPWNSANWKGLSGDISSSNDGRADMFVAAICAANGRSTWQVATTDRDPSERWAGKKPQWKDNKTWAKLYDKMMQKPGQAWKGNIFSTGNVDDNANGVGNGDGELRKKEGDDARTKLNHPKNANSIDLSTDLRGAMEDSLIWQYKNLHRQGTSAWSPSQYRKAVKNAEANAPLYESFYKLMSTWSNAWKTYQLIVNPSPNSATAVNAPCFPQSYNPSAAALKTHQAWRGFSPDNMPDAELLNKFQTELNKRDRDEQRVAGVWEGGFNAGRYVARATMDTSKAEKCLRKDVEAADQYLRRGQFDQQTMAAFWTSLNSMANYHNSDDHLSWLVDLSAENKNNPATGVKKGEKDVKQCEEDKSTEGGEKKTTGDEPTGLGWGWITVIVLGSLAVLAGVVALCFIFCAGESADDGL